MPSPPDPDLVAFYTTRYRERDRLTASPHGRLELARTRELLRRLLPPPPARVLDVGGGPGVHARWLRDDGYDVHLLDLLPTHVRQALDDGAVVGAAAADACALPVASGSVDAVLLLGPLYHLVRREQRVRAVVEARRVARPGGVVVAAAISRYAALLDTGARGRLDAEALGRATDVVATGWHDPRLGFTTAYFHRPEELAGELTEAGLLEVEVYGVEGPLWMALDAAGDSAVPDDSAALLDSAVRCARAVERDPALLAASAHLLAVAHT